jgi:hypothetical protein
MASTCKSDTSTSASASENSECRQPTRENLIQTVRRDGRSIRFALPWVKDDIEIALAAVSCGNPVWSDCNWSGYRYLSKRLKCKLRVVRKALRCNSKQMQYVPRILKYNPLLRSYLVGLKNKTYRRECLKICQGGCCISLSKFPMKIRRDREIVIAQVMRIGCGTDLEWASSELKKDEGVVRTSLTGDDECEGGYRFADISLRLNPVIMRDAIAACPQTMKFVPLERQDDMELAQFSMECHESAIKFLAPCFKENYFCNLFAVQKKFEAIEHVGEVFAQDLSICVAAARTYVSLIGKPKSRISSFLFFEKFCNISHLIDREEFEKAVTSHIAVKGECALIFSVTSMEPEAQEGQGKDDKTYFHLRSNTMGGTSFSGRYQEDAIVSNLAKDISDFWSCENVYLAFGICSVTPFQSSKTILSLFRENCLAV